MLEDNQKQEDCYYLFELDTNAICPVIPSKLSAGSIFLIVWVLQHSQRDHTINGYQGETWITFAHTLHVMLLFAVHSVFSCLAVYLTGGFLYQRLVVGAKGVEQFPNYGFWSQIGNLSAVGVITCALVSVSDSRFSHSYSLWTRYTLLLSQQDGCDFVCRSRGNREEPPTYRGVATEPLGEEPEERDDHLLPMWPNHNNQWEDAGQLWFWNPKRDVQFSRRVPSSEVLLFFSFFFSSQ